MFKRTPRKQIVTFGWQNRKILPKATPTSFLASLSCNLSALLKKVALFPLLSPLSQASSFFFSPQFLPTKTETRKLLYSFFWQPVSPFSPFITHNCQPLQISFSFHFIAEGPLLVRDGSMFVTYARDDELRQV